MHLKTIPPSEYDGHLREKPLGKDRNNNLYWTLDEHDITARIYKESPPLYNEAGVQVAGIGRGYLRNYYLGKWETVCTTLEELTQFATTLSQDDKDENLLYQTITNILIPPLQEQEKQRQLEARKLAKQEMNGVSVKNIVTNSRTRTSRKLINYAYEDEVDYNFEDYE